MSCSTFFAGDTVIHRLDARGRVVATLAYALLVPLCTRFPVLLLAAGLSVAATVAARIPVGPLSRRLVRVNVFTSLIFVLLPPTMPGRELFAVGPLAFTYEGLALASRIALKANGIVLMFTALMGTVEISELGHAFQRLRVPRKLVHLFMFTLRYLDVLHHEYEGLLRAMKARAFRGRMSLHTYKAYGYLLAMLLVRSLERAERIMDAMKCRGFKGEFHAYRRFAFSGRDVTFSLMVALLLGALAGLEWW